LSYDHTNKDLNL